MRAISSPRRKWPFSASSSSLRAASHSSQVPVACVGIVAPLRSSTGAHIVSTMTNDPFKALGHPLRRGIVERLSGGTVTVGEATRGLGVSKPTISRHLKVLEEAGVVTRMIEGRTHRLVLQPQTLADAAGWLE